MDYPFFTETQKYGARKLPIKMVYYAMEKHSEQVETVGSSIDIQEETKYEILQATDLENKQSYNFSVLGCEQATAMHLPSENGIVLSQRNGLYSDSVVAKIYLVGSLESDMDSPLVVRLLEGEEHVLQYGEVLMIPGFYGFDVLSSNPSAKLLAFSLVGEAFR